MMRAFHRLGSGVDVSALALELFRQPELWDQNTTRRTYPDTPHGDMTDIWVRFRSPDAVTSLEDHQTEYRCVMWPAWFKLPSLRPIIFAMMTKVGAVELGSILITRLPENGSIKPHSDAGSWAAEFYNMKLHLIVQGKAVVTCQDEMVVFERGELFTFDNLQVHSVMNHWTEDRIALIVSMRVEA
jgi:mannose-6-phosphate isomerase-like protein (cupin superfamily)